MTARIVVIANQKGGVGKTTTSINFAASLAILEHMVLLVDLDPQGHSTTGLGFEKPNDQAGAYALLTGTPAEALVLNTEIATLQIIPAGKDLARLEFSDLTDESQLYNLKNALNQIKENYDYIVIDSPPALGTMTLNAFTAADELIVPMPCEFLAMDGLVELVDTLNAVQKQSNPSLQLGGILLTMAEERTNLGSAVANEVRKSFPGKVFKTSIPRNIRLAEAPSHGKPIAFYDLKSKGAQAYIYFTKEWLRRKKNEFTKDTV